MSRPFSSVSLLLAGALIAGDISRMSVDPSVQEALRKLAADQVPTSVSQLVMWRLSGRLDWDTIARLSEGWANRYELTLARRFVDGLGAKTGPVKGRLHFEFEGSDAAGKRAEEQLARLMRGKTVLGLQAAIGVAPRPAEPSVACRVRLSGTGAEIRVMGSDSELRSWANLGQFTLPVARGGDDFEVVPFADRLAEGILDRLVRARLVKGAHVNGRPTYGIKIENASPLILNGVALARSGSRTDHTSPIIWGIGVAPHRELIVPVREDMIGVIGLRRGVQVTALDLNGL